MNKHIKAHQVQNTFIYDKDTDLTSCYEKATSHALTDYSTLCLIQVELTIPGASCANKETLLQFAEHFQTMINKKRKGIKHKCHTRFIWGALADKYQLTVILNREAYPKITNYCSNISFVAKTIEASWANAFSCTVGDLRGKVKYPMNAVSYVSANHCT